jgi:hypothetical protein
MKADGFLVMAHGTAAEVGRAKMILGTVKPSRLDVHTDMKAAEQADYMMKEQDRFDRAMTP